MGNQAPQSAAEFRNTARPIFSGAPVQTKRVPITRGPYASAAARRAKIPTVKEMNRQIAANREELLRRARDNCRRLTGSDQF